MISRDEIEPYRGYIEAALEYSGGSHTYDDVLAQLDSGMLQFWPGVHSAMVTQIVDTPRKRTLHVFLAGGNLAELEAMSPILQQWGISQGCTHASFEGRPGWERTFLTRTGWEKSTTVVFEKSLT